ncbi:hypothetical protein ACT91Q_01465 [Brevibacillus thermoruber]|uniref:hypothetical protein n=1 Tax=Brevibacillus thermoruber TaxID=33942 RepID=UPI004042D7F3
MELWQIITSFISSIGMFIVTLFYVVYTKKILKANQGMFEESIKARKQELMPNVIAYFDMPELNALHFVVKNIGRSVAVNTRVELEPIIDFPKKEYLSRSNLVNELIPTIAPDQKLVTFVQMMFDLKNQDGDFPKFKASIYFEDINGEKYHSQYILDVNVWKGAIRLGEKFGVHDLVEEVKGIKELLAKKN